MILANVAAALPGERDFRLVNIFIKGGKIASIKEADLKKKTDNPLENINSGANEATDLHAYDDEEIIEDIGDNDTSGAVTTSTTTMQLIKKFWWIPFLIALSFLFGALYKDKPKKVKRKVKKK